MTDRRFSTVAVSIMMAIKLIFGRLPFELIYVLMLVQTVEDTVLRRIGVAEISGTLENLQVNWKSRNVVVV